MHSLTATAIGPPGREPLGVMLLGKLKPGGFDDAWSEVWLSAAATGLLHHMRPGQVAQASSILRTIDEAHDPVTAISVLLQSGAKFMFRAVNIAMGVRLALIDESGRTALVFESAKAARRKVEPLLEAGKTVAPPANPGCDVTVRELPLQNTLLASAVSQKKARFVKDCASYMQNCPAPARDVFTHATELVSSVVVVPLLVGDAVLGALYFTQDTPCDFSNIQDALLGFVHAVTLALHNKLAGQMAQMRAMLKTANRPSRGGSDSQPNSQATNPVIRQLETSESEDAADHDPSDDQEPPSPEDSVPPLSQSGASGGRLSKISSRRLCTEGMLRSLQQEIRKGKRRSVELSFMANQLMIYEPIGRGGFGRVYRGSWHKRPAAIKVMNARATDSEAVSDAMEMAVLSTVNHPNIVQVYSCLTDMVEAPGLCGAAAGGKTVPFYRRMLPGEDEDQPTYNIVVMEFMDR
ncbi:hypothetical protein MNEG_14437 [Monoraphidium neglectum]|uniref:Protein kinase domain-containing protein n=1 Tax=Monoraphidium neglectum TaxID=145388 RepID=A0A0D2MEC9_9CHLO|nr:hypothetical protein MNEG_14437 [Monoraphidium neglectum]KIY93525.1 hypothetical protein MNEG_14437 [Monoraphidium neglectum]|eukprot:XP_013892545.1 hypothetical protein MNEG_14437 [Monoraphidium neglectum]